MLEETVSSHDRSQPSIPIANEAIRSLRESEERFRLAFEHAAFAMVLVSPQGRFMRVNQSACRMFGYAEEELLQRTFQSLTHPDDLEVGLELFKDLISGQRDYGWLEKRYVHRDGSVIWAVLSTAAVRGPQGETLYMVSQIQDITERKAAEARLVESEERYRSIFEATTDGLVICDFNGVILEVNPAFMAARGFRREELIGQLPTIFLDPGSWPLFQEAVRTTQVGREYRANSVHVRKDGSQFPVDVRVQPFTYQARPCMLAVTRDLTDLLAAQQLLEQRVAARTRELQALYDVTAVAGASLDLATVMQQSLDRVADLMDCEITSIHLLNPEHGDVHLAAWCSRSPGIAGEAELAAVASAAAAQVIRQASPLMLPELAAHDSEPAMAGALAADKVFAGFPIQAKGRVLGTLGAFRRACRRFDSEEVALLLSIAGQVGVAVENARLYQQAEKLAVVEERQRLARELHDAVTQTLYSAVLMAETGRRAAAAGDLGTAEGYLRRLGEVTKDALKEMRLLVYELRPSALEHEGFVPALQRRLAAVEKRSDIKTHLSVVGEVDLAPEVEEGLYRIAQEALNNALKHAGANSVAVELRSDGGWVELTVADDGRGFSLPLSPLAGGLGLASMRERAEMLGGSLTIDSVPGKGTRIQVRLGREPKR